MGRRLTKKPAAFVFLPAGTALGSPLSAGLARKQGFVADKTGGHTHTSTRLSWTKASVLCFLRNNLAAPPRRPFGVVSRQRCGTETDVSKPRAVNRDHDESQKPTVTNSITPFTAGSIVREQAV